MLPILREIRTCQVCARELPLGPKPLVAGTGRSRVLLTGQAPGRVAHECGTPWKDRSGDRLRDWLGVDEETFYDPDAFAIMPMGFCYPGTGSTGDLAPRAECAPLWHDQFRTQLRSVRLHVFVGQYPLPRYFPGGYGSLTGAVQDFARLLPERVVLPHPSPRNGIWMAKNPWFKEEVVPALRGAVQEALGRRKPV